MSGAIRFAQVGGPEVLRWENVELAAPRAGQVCIRQEYIGVNFIDIYHRSGLYALDLPQTLGMEAAGVVEGVGEGVTGFVAGDRVAYALTLGAYAERRVISAEHLVKLPSSISTRTAAAAMLKGMTARFLLRDSYPIKAGDYVLVTAAAGGVGSLLCQWASALGAVVIGSVGSDAKAEAARARGCQFTVNYRQEDVASAVRRITDGSGVAVAYDSVGRDTLDASLASLRPTGTLVSYGNASGAIRGFDVGRLAESGSLYLQRPTLRTYIRNRALLEAAAADLFKAIDDRLIDVNVGHAYALKDAALAHRDVEARHTSGSVLLTV